MEKSLVPISIKMPLDSSFLLLENLLRAKSFIIFFLSNIFLI